MRLDSIDTTDIEVVEGYVRITQQDEAGNEPSVVMFPLWAMETVWPRIGIAVAQAQAAETK
jgi:hypothetical protein